MKEIKYSDKIDKEKLKAFIMATYGSIRNFAYHAGINYHHFTTTLNGSHDRDINPKFMAKVIKQFNRGILFDRFEKKLTPEITEVYFFKKSNANIGQK